jgi:oxygen-independent coproporphyrinogen III oxidase
LEPVGVYIHYPYCRSRCSYCDFAIAVAPEPEIPHAAYLRAVAGELGERAPSFAGRELQSIYLGGGTPSLWPAACLAEIIAAVRAAFGERREPLEVTLEANPTDCEAGALAAWRRAGITRLSIGVQSTDATELRTLGRDHRMGDGGAALARAVGAGFASVSADLILGVPGPVDPPARARRSIAEITGAAPDHISVYELTFEPSTPLEARRRRGEVAALADDQLADLYETTHHELEARGYEHYEISSFAQRGHRAVHNSLYWRGAEYLGIGSGACSFLRTPDGGGVRWQNHRSVRTYLASEGEDRIAERDPLRPEELAADRLWLGLRTSEGVLRAAFDDRPELLRWLLDSGLAQPHEDSIRPTLRGFLYADQVAGRAILDRG